MAQQGKIDNKKLSIGVLACFGGLFVHLVIGSLYQWGIVSVYYTSYYHAMDQSVTLESNAIAFPLMMACIGLTMRLGLFLASITHPVIILTASQILAAGSVLISSVMPSDWLFILFYGILFGLFAGMSFMIPIYECNNYLVGKKIYVNGVILIGTGCGPIVFGLFSYFYLNPNKLPPLHGYYNQNQQLENIAQKVPYLLKWLSLIYLSIGLTGVLMLAPACIHNRKAELQAQQTLQKQKQKKHEALQTRMHQNLQDDHECSIIQEEPHINAHHHENSLTHIKHQPKVQTKQTQLTTKHQSAKVVEKGTTQNSLKPSNQADSIKEGITSKVFWISMIIILMSSCGCFMINGNYKLYVKSIINDDFFLTVVGVIASVGNGFSRFFWSLYLNKTGYKTILMTINGICIAVFITIRFAKYNEVAYLIEIFLVNCCLGGFLVTAPTAVHSIYGHRTGSNIYGFYWEIFSTATFIGYVYVSFLAKAISFDNVIYVCLGMCVIAIPIIIFTEFKGPWSNDTALLGFCIGCQQEKKQNIPQNVPQNASMYQIQIKK